MWGLVGQVFSPLPAFWQLFCGPGADAGMRVSCRSIADLFSLPSSTEPGSSFASHGDAASTTCPAVRSRPPAVPPLRRLSPSILPPLPPHSPHPAPTTPLPSLPSSPTSEIPLPLPAAPAPYHDCPAVVRTTSQPPASSSLPAFLAAECADFASSTAAPTLSSPPRILPSELCLLRREVDSWGCHHPPGAYSYAAARVVEALRLGALQWEVELRRWLLASSPKYGIVIDAASRDHVFVLVRLCMKAAAAEAGCSLERLPKGEGEEFRLDPRPVRFECPRLVDGVSWLASQLEVLYGKGNGWFFAITAVKEAILRLGSCLAVGVGDGVAGGASEKGCELRDTGTCPIFVSQVAAAIAALHDRLSLDKKIRALQAPRPSKYQLLLEYSQILKQGCDERSKRPNYRAVLDYDGILPRQMDNQESGRSKTREELLAEERDYKRRRMSYRGKKMKRNPTELNPSVRLHFRRILVG
uniref:CHHC U11-48K-type domain-containing protein n=1 Tax=Aegilops tauschii TaxID=37682 RepID=M8CBA3_AEGTA